MPDIRRWGQTLPMGGGFQGCRLYTRFPFIPQEPPAEPVLRAETACAGAAAAKPSSGPAVQALPALAPGEGTLDGLEGFALAQGPGGGHEFIGMRVAGHPLNHGVRR